MDQGMEGYQDWLREVAKSLGQPVQKVAKVAGIEQLFVLSPTDAAEQLRGFPEFTYEKTPGGNLNQDLINAKHALEALGHTKVDLESPDDVLLAIAWFKEHGEAICLDPRATPALIKMYEVAIQMLVQLRGPHA